MNVIKKAFGISTRIKVLILCVIVLILAASIMCGRLVWFQQGLYKTPEITAIDVGAVPTANYQPVVDKPVMGEGHVVIDLAHNNNLLVDDLSPLKDRLQARGATVETFTGDGSLGAYLHEATALVVIAPGQRYTASELKAVIDFVEDGGQLLLVADPTRPVSYGDPNDPYSSPYDALYATSAVPAINSLANAFGIVYYDDYLYNLEDNAGSYRNVKFTAFEKNALTKDVETLVLFVTHSLSSDGVSLIAGDKNTLSPVRSGETNLAAAALTTDQRVLALGDLTFMTAPYHTVEDNDQFLSNIANWLATDKRDRNDLEDFPYIFDEPIDLVQVGGETLDPQLIVQSSKWQASFEQAGHMLSLRAEADPEHDAIFVGTFKDTEVVDELLSSNGVTLTVTVEKGEDEEKVAGSIGIKGLGTVTVEGTTLLVLDRSSERVAIIVLAPDMEKAIEATGRLIDHDLSGCVRADAVTVCSTGEAPTKPKEPEEPSDGGELPPAAGRILVIASDDKPVGARTGAPEFEAILSDSYDVTVWYTSRDGPPTVDDVEGYDAYIIDTGDYAADEADIDIFAAFAEIESAGVMFIGAQPLPFFVDFEPIDDLQVADTTHPLAAGFEPGEILALSASESGVPAVVAAEDEGDTAEGTSIVFRRGPDSSSPGTAVVIASEDEALNIRMIIALFSFYRLPEDAQRTFALNAAAWLVGAEE
ncbi:MAG: DUF4350 domain-containing protein [Anaerolineae bacterium]|nr:DUF4350 domain-containing protein [Anaerolineae bacterium]